MDLTYGFSMTGVIFLLLSIIVFISLMSPPDVLSDHRTVKATRARVGWILLALSACSFFIAVWCYAAVSQACT